MNVDMLYAKIHRATVTGAELNYEGSISISPTLLAATELLINQKVDMYNCNNGARFSTYVIKGKDQEICLNGAAARHVQAGDKVIIVAYASMDLDAAKTHQPKVVFVHDDNTVKDLHVEQHSTEA